MTGYSYGENNSAYFYISNRWDSGATFTLHFVKNSNWGAYRVRNVNDQDGADTKAGRGFSLGINEGSSSTTQTGNNEKRSISTS